MAPQGSCPSGDPTLHLWPVGRLWDALRTPVAVGMPVLDRLLADPDDAALLGPVLWDRVAGHLYWLLAPGASDTYPRTAVLLPAGSWLAAPPVVGRSRRVVWLHLPDCPRLTGPVWLAAALWNHPHHRPGASAMPDPQLSPEPPACAMCTEPPSASGPVLGIGLDDAPVDIGHQHCARRASAEIQARFRAVRPIPARAS
jgi:hypothetical protein